MTLDVQVLVVAFLALSLHLVVEWTGRQISTASDSKANERHDRHV
jgi:hypothetical protein